MRDRKTLADVAAELSRTQATQLDAGCAALLRAGVHPLDLEIVSEICPPQADDGMVVTCRTYVRAGRRRDEQEYARAIADVRERVLSMVTHDGMSEGQRDAYCLALLDVQRVLDEVRDGE